MFSLYKIILWIGYIFIFIGAFLGFKEEHKKKDGIKAYCQWGIIPLAFLSFIRHTFLHGNIIQTNSPFFEFEAGGANLGVTIALVVALSMKTNAKTLALILLVYAVYLMISMISSFLYVGLKKGLLFIPLLLITYYFIIKGFIPKKKKTLEKMRNNYVLSY